MRMFNALFPVLPSPRTPLAAPACCRGARNRGELAEKHRHSIMDVADRRTSWAGEDYKATVAIALLSGQSGQVQHRLWGADRVLDFCCAGLLPFKVPAGRNQATDTPALLETSLLTDTRSALPELLPYVSLLV